jgi:hypothetical protein
MRSVGTGAGSPRTSLLRMDWGGDPNEFLEYVVGVGLVTRRLSHVASPVERTDDRRRRHREPVTLVAASKVAQTASSTDFAVTIVAANAVQPAVSADRTITRAS